MAELRLPEAPSDQSGPVKVWSEAVVIATYEPMAADRNPMFLQKRVYQGSSGKVYPLPFTDRVATQAEERTWQAVHLENEFVRVMVLPEIGGRIHVGLDKTNGYDFFYRQNVIKPALVGLAGPWISGGVEFNWPQHHRPSTFMATDVHIERHADGSVTAWFSEHEPMNRMKGMHGVCLHPGKAFIELKVRLYNRTALVQTFLWWANVAVRVHERYQSFFPPDVVYIADHAKRATSEFPLCRGQYYGVDYGARAGHGMAAAQRPRDFVPPGEYAANDLSWYANIPVPTSYMAMGSSADFFGGYDHAQQAGIVHVANHHIAPGKKQWTWGNHEFGYAWDRNLTDSDGPYIELMAGVYTDNQPDFSFLAPGETRTFSQYWYPIQQIGPAQQANVDAALSLRVQRNTVRVGVSVSGVFTGAAVRLERNGKTVAQWQRDLAPGRPMVETWSAPAGRVKETELRLSVVAADGRELIEYAPKRRRTGAISPPATEPPPPREIASSDELYITGLHLAQYRHATRGPESYWNEALRRDPGDSRCNNAMGIWHLRRGEFTEAERHFRSAIERLTRRNPNPYDGEPYYNLGLCLRYLEREEEAYAALYKATWNRAWQAPALAALAEIDMSRRDWTTAIEHIDRALGVNADDLKSRNLKAVALRRLGRAGEAELLLRQTLEMDPLDFMARHLLGRPLSRDAQVRVDLAIDYARAGLLEEGIDVLCGVGEDNSGALALIGYYLGDLYQRKGCSEAAADARAKAAAARPDYCFPSRLEDIAVLESAMEADRRDSRAPYYLGSLLYDRRRHREAIRLWERSARLDGDFPVVWRNLGIGYFNVLQDPAKARRAFERALKANPMDARVLYERDQLWKRLGEAPERRLAELEKYRELVEQRDDLSVELAALFNQTGQHQRALEVMERRHFQPWEGGEGMALGQHVRTHLALGRAALANGDASEAQRDFERALTSPRNLGEARHVLANAADVYYWLGMACAGAGKRAAARARWKRAAAFRGDFQDMRVRRFSEMTYYSALAMQRLGQAAAARRLLRGLQGYARQLSKTAPTIDYFATSLPAMLLFEDDLRRGNEVHATFLSAQAQLGLGRRAAARRLLQRVLKLDVNHAMAADLLAEIEDRATARSGSGVRRAQGSRVRKAAKR